MLLRYEDKNAMAYSIETRLPFLDPDLVEFGLNLPVQLKVHNGWSKYVLRKVVHEKLPQEIVWRRGKVGFEAPFRDIQSSRMKEGIGNVLFDRNFRGASLGHSWGYFCLNSWYGSIISQSVTESAIG
jgi:asparagine synthetase B (glutamine-hydrolysing)